MSVGAADPDPTDDAVTLFDYEVRREQRVVARLRAVPNGGGITVESEVYPVTQADGTTPVMRPFAFQTLEQARRFADEALVAFEYLNCTVS